MTQFRNLVVVTGALLGARTMAAQEPITVTDAVRRSLAEYPSIVAAHDELAAASAGLREAKASWWPRLELNAKTTLFEEPMVVAPIHSLAAGPGGLANPPLFDRTLYGGTVALGYRLIDWGRAPRIKAAQAGRAGAAAQATGSEMRLMARVVRTYLRSLTLRSTLAAHDRQLTALASEHDRVERQLAQGTAPEVEQFRADAALKSAEADRVTTAADLSATLRDLSRLVGLTGDVLPASRLRDVVLAAGFEAGGRDSLVARAAHRNPDVLAAREAAASAEATRRVAKAEWLPNLNVSAGLTGYGGADSFTTEWQVGVGVSYPLFTGGARGNRVGQAAAASDAAAARAREAELGAADAADRALAALEASAGRTEALAAAVKHLAEVVRVERLSLDVGSGVQTDYLRAEADLMRARAALAQARYAHIAAVVDLAAITGDLTPEWLAGMVETTP